jgi:hypothetical protein
MMVRVDTGDGEYLFLDATAPGSGSGLDSGYRGLRYLALTDPGSGMEVFPDPPSGDTLCITVEGVLSRSPDRVIGDVTIRTSGSVEDLYRSMLGRVPAERWPELLDLLTGAVPGSGSWTVPDPLDTSVPFVISGTCTWSAPTLDIPEGTAYSLPGLQEMSLTGTRTAALLLPVELSDHGIRLQTPVLESLDMTLTGFSGVLTGARTYSAGCWTRQVSATPAGDIRITEECQMSPALPDSTVTGGIIEGLRARCSECLRVVIIS